VWSLKKKKTQNQKFLIFLIHDLTILPIYNMRPNKRLINYVEVVCETEGKKIKNILINLVVIWFFFLPFYTELINSLKLKQCSKVLSIKWTKNRLIFLRKYTISDLALQASHMKPSKYHFCIQIYSKSTSMVFQLLKYTKRLKTINIKQKTATSNEPFFF
jgi:hypothetical protein